MKKTIFVLILSIFLTGCFNYRDINRIVFVTALCIDIDEDNNPVLYAEAFRGIRSAEAASGTESRIIFKGRGDSVFEAIRNMNRTSSLKLNYTQNRAIIFSERAARYGLDNFLDVLMRDQELLVRQFLYISTIDLEELLKTKLDEEMFTGIYLADLSENKPSQTEEPLIRIDEFYIRRKLGSKINAISVIEKKGDSIIDRIVINRLAIINEDKMISILDANESFFYELVKNNIQMGFLRTTNPEEKDKLVDLEILKAKTKTHTNWNGSILDITKEINIKTTIAEAQKTLTITKDPKERGLLEESAQKMLKESCINLYEKYKEKDIDLFNLKRLVDIKYPNIDVDKDNILDYVNLTIEPNVFIEGSTDVVNFY